MNGKFVVAQAHGTWRLSVQSRVSKTILCFPAGHHAVAVVFEVESSGVLDRRSAQPVPFESPSRYVKMRRGTRAQTDAHTDKTTVYEYRTIAFSSGQVQRRDGRVLLRSMWGRLSTNASTAFSVVQGAVEDVTKELRNVSTGPNQELKEGELKSRSELGVWGEDEAAGSSSTPSSRWNPASRPIDYSTTTTNPWAATTVKGTPPTTSSGLSDNPWKSVKPKPDFSELHLLDLRHRRG
jgi:hypothetical protein